MRTPAHGGRQRRLSYANVMSTIAVFLALGGTATAAELVITGRDVRDGSITGRDIKNRSIGRADLSAGARGGGGVGAREPKGGDGARGERGPRGETGPSGLDGDAGTTGMAGPEGPRGEKGPAGADGSAGPAGAVGPAGPAGPSSVAKLYTGVRNEAPGTDWNTWATFATISLPAGEYLVTAQGSAEFGGQVPLSCVLDGPTEPDATFQFNAYAHVVQPFHVDAPITSDADFAMELKCRQDGAGSYPNLGSVTLSATAVDLH